MKHLIAAIVTVVIIIIMFIAFTFSCNSKPIKNAITYTEVQGNIQPYIKIVDHNIRITSCDNGMCYVFTSVSIKAYNPQPEAIKSRIDCIYKVNKIPKDKTVSKWFTLSSNTVANLNPIEHTLVVIMDEPTPITVSCGISWDTPTNQKVSTIHTYKQKVITHYAKTITETVVPTLDSTNKQ